MIGVSEWLTKLREWAWAQSAPSVGDQAAAQATIRLLKIDTGVDWNEQLWSAKDSDERDASELARAARNTEAQERNAEAPELSRWQAVSVSLLSNAISENRGHHAEQAEKRFLAEACLARIRHKWTTEWMASGFPQVVVSPKLFASLAATDVPAGLLPDELGYPWRCFVVRVPEEFHASAVPWFPEGDGRRLSPGFMVSREPEEEGPGHRPRRLRRLHIFAAQKTSLSLDFNFETLEELYQQAPSYSAGLGLSVDDDAGSLILGQPLVSWGSDLDAATKWLREYKEKHGNTIPTQLVTPEALEQANAMRRAFAGVVMEMMDPRHREAIQQATRPREIKKRGEGIKASTFVLKRPVVVDVREWLSQSMSGAGRGGPHMVQSIVRGHWKRQAYGPNGSLRKHIRIEPYLRGAPDAPLAVRQHSLVARGAAS